MKKKINKKIKIILKIKFLMKLIIFFFLSILFKSFRNTIYKIETFNIKQFFNTSIRNNSILIFEKNNYHYECTPGFTKYLLDLGFNVDIIMTNIGIESFIFFEPTRKLRFFLIDNTKYNKREEHLEKYREIFKKYLAILIQTTNNKVKYFCRKLNLLNWKNSIFVFHDYPQIKRFNFHNKIRSWTLLKFTNLTLEVNPHYFGNIKLRDKNKLTRFFIVSTGKRHYDELISASNILNNENYQFQVVVTGRSKALNPQIIPKNIKDKFLFNLNLSYQNLLKIIETIDFIIITLNRKNPNDNNYINRKSTGSAQIVYGFLKPCLINSDFANTYRINNENSIIFNNSKDSLYFAMREAIMMTTEEYKKKQYNLKKTADIIYEISKNNVKTTINYILKS